MRRIQQQELFMRGFLEFHAKKKGIRISRHVYRSTRKKLWSISCPRFDVAFDREFKQVGDRVNRLVKRKIFN